MSIRILNVAAAGCFIALAVRCSAAAAEDPIPPSAQGVLRPRDRHDDALPRRAVADARVARPRRRLRDDARRARRSAGPDRLRHGLRQRLLHAAAGASSSATSGKVIAVDIQREMLGLLKDRAAAEKIDNIEPVLGTVVDPQLDAEFVSTWC